MFQVRDDGVVHYGGNKRGSGKWLESGFNLKVEPTSLADVFGMGTKRKKHQRRLLILQIRGTDLFSAI